MQSRVYMWKQVILPPSLPSLSLSLSFPQAALPTPLYILYSTVTVTTTLSCQVIQNHEKVSDPSRGVKSLLLGDTAVDDFFFFAAVDIVRIVTFVQCTES